MLTNNESSQSHWVITVEIMKFFETDFEAFSCNLLINKRKGNTIFANKDTIIKKMILWTIKRPENWNKFGKDRELH